MATKAIPITKNAGKTVPAVSIGCQAGNFCWLKSLSGKRKSNNLKIFKDIQETHDLRVWTFI